MVRCGFREYHAEQRPHDCGLPEQAGIAGSVVGLLGAKTESFFLRRLEPQCGHVAFEVRLRTRISESLVQTSQWYSKIGMRGNLARRRAEMKRENTRAIGQFCVSQLFNS